MKKLLPIWIAIAASLLLTACAGAQPSSTASVTKTNKNNTAEIAAQAKASFEQKNYAAALKTIKTINPSNATEETTSLAAEIQAAFDARLAELKSKVVVEEKETSETISIFPKDYSPEDDHFYLYVAQRDGVYFIKLATGTLFVANKGMILSIKKITVEAAGLTTEVPFNVLTDYEIGPTKPVNWIATAPMYVHTKLEEDIKNWIIKNVITCTEESTIIFKDTTMDRIKKFKVSEKDKEISKLMLEYYDYITVQ